MEKRSLLCECLKVKVSLTCLCTCDCCDVVIVVCAPDGNVVPGCGVWDLLLPQLLHLGRALVWSGEFLPLKVKFSGYAALVVEVKDLQQSVAGGGGGYWEERLLMSPE